MLLFVAASIGFGLASAPAQAGVAATQNQIHNPILPLGADDTDSPDPWLFKHDGKYWINYTSNGKLVYRVAPQMAALGSAPERQLWPVEGQSDPDDRNSEYWAPEIHRVKGKWYVYYTANGGQVDVGKHRMYVLESETSSPAGPYQYKGEITVPQPFAIDGTVIELNGKIYYSYSAGPSFQPTSIYLAELSNPWTLAGTPILVSAPEYGWEKSILPINEGPEFLLHGNKLHLIFSASWCGSGLYALGRLTVPKNADLTDPNTWVGAKYPNPVFETDAANGVFGPGHGSFLTTGGGREFWNVYHATDEAGKGCFTGGLRTTRIQRFTWDSEGNPRFGKPVAVTTGIRAPKADLSTAIQAENSRFLAPKRAVLLNERKFYGYTGRTLTPKGGQLPPLRFSLKRKGRYQIFVRVLAGPETPPVTLARKGRPNVTRKTARSAAMAIELNMGTTRLGAGNQSLRLLASAPIAVDQIRLQLRK